MPILTSEEEKQKSNRKQELKSVILKFRDDYLSSFLIGIKVGGLFLASAIIIYLVAKLGFKWDLFYETDLKYSSIFLFITAMFFIIVILCIIVAVILFNTKHKRNTKYRNSDNNTGG